MKFTPYNYQQYCIDKIIEMPVLGLFLDMGLGKTVITLSAIRDLKYNRFSVGKCLVIAPKMVAEDTWQTEASKWDHLQGLRISSVLGTATQRKRGLEADADVYVINRENTQWLVDYYKWDWPFDTVVLDESSSFKNHQAKRFKALKTVRPKISRLVELTGTPRPNSLIDLWAQIYLLDGGKRLGRTISCYRDYYFVPGKRNQTVVYTYDPRPGAEEAIQTAISDICISMKAEDYLDLPEMLYDDIPVRLDDKAQEAYKRLERDMVLEIKDDVVTAATAAALSGKLLQLCAGAVYNENHEVVPVHDCKIAAFMELIEQLNGEHSLVCYYFQHDLDRLMKALSGTDLRVRVYQDSRDKAAWNAGEVDLLLIHPASCGKGLNLQEGGHHIIWFTLTQSLEDYQQMNKRLHRQGQPHPVIVHHLLVKGGRDYAVRNALTGKGKAQDSLLDSIKVTIEEVRKEYST